MGRISKRKAIVAVLTIIGLYFLLWHKDPLPGNHEAIGLGMGDIFSMVHITHDIIGLILIGGGVLVWWKSRTVSTPVAPSQTAK